MSDDNTTASAPDFVSYLSIKIENDDKAAATFRLSPTLEDAEQFREIHSNGVYHEDKAPSEPSNLSGSGTEHNLQNICSEQMQKFYVSLLPFHELVMVSHFIRPVMAKVAIEGDILKTVRSKGTLINSNENVETYGLNSHVSNEIIQSVSKINKMDRGLAMMPSSTLLSMVATFDSMVGDSIKSLLHAKPEKISNSERTISYRDLFSIGNLDEAKGRFIDEEVSKLLRGSHDEQVQYLEKLIDTKIRDHYSRWPNFLEIFERRNIIAHSNGIINNIYIDKCKSYLYPIKEAKLGDAVKLDPKYLHKAIDILTEFGVLVWFVAWRKIAGHSEAQAYEKLNSIVFEAIKSKRFNLSIWLLDFALHRQPRNGGDLTTRMMFINLANAYKKKGNIDKCKETLGEMDWSATSDLFSLALASLKDDVEGASSLMAGLARSGKLTADQFREWPVFDWIREESTIEKAFEESFGEPLVQRIEETTALVDSRVDDIPSSVEDVQTNPLPLGLQTRH